MSGLSRTSKEYWIEIIRDRIKTLRDIYMAENAIDRKAMVTAREYILAHDIGADLVIEQYEAVIQGIKSLEEQKKEIAKKFEDLVVERYPERYDAIVRNGNSRYRGTHYRSTSPSFKYFNHEAAEQIDNELMQIPELAAYAKMLEQVPMKIELTTTSARLREYLMQLLPEIGIELDE